MSYYIMQCLFCLNQSDLRRSFVTHVFLETINQLPNEGPSLEMSNSDYIVPGSKRLVLCAFISFILMFEFFETTISFAWLV